jgi:hypothetical protein
MSFTFIKNDKYSFNRFSRVYEVYDYDNKDSLRTALVIGYISRIKKYYITTLGAESLRFNYDLERDIVTTTEFVAILQEFFNIVEFIDPGDFIIDKTILIECVPLQKENFLTYVTEVEPYYNEDIEAYDGTIVTYEDDNARYLMDEGIFNVCTMYNDIDDKYEPYDYALFKEHWFETSDTEIYCEIDFDKLYNF